MIVRSAAGVVEVLAPAKVNLFLEILGKRADGYHEVETLMAPVAIYDTLSFQPNEGGSIEFACERALVASPGDGTAPAALPEGSDNLVVRAVELLRQRKAVARGAALRLIKRIPIAAGLAGGSTDAAAALIAASLGWGLHCSPAELSEIAAELGSDIPFFFGRGPAICRGRGERVEPLAGLGRLHLVAVAPPAGLSTAEVFRACRPAAQPCSPASLVQAWAAGRLDEVGRLLHNRLQPAAEGLSPWIARLKREFDRLNVCGHSMSGSGSSYFGICRHARHARRVAAILGARRIGRAFATATCH